MTHPTNGEAMAVVKAAISAIAPDIEEELESIDPGIDLWEDLELDSMDHLNIMVELNEKTGVDVPERDYPHLRSLRAIVDYLAAASS